MEILYAPTDEARSDRITRFIRIANKLYHYNNMHSLFAILSGLQSAPVYRLRKAWKVCLERGEKYMFSHHLHHSGSTRKIVGEISKARECHVRK